jgi:hypothetical protein
MPRHDYCKGVRTVYDKLLKAFASNNIVAGAITGCPYYYLFGIGTYQTRMAIGYYTSAVWVFSAVLTLAWIVGIIAMWKTMPNLLTSTIFIYKAFGYWCLVSFFLVLGYITPYLPAGYLGLIVAAILPSILFLLICADILREVRARLYKVLETPTVPLTVLPSVDTRPVVQV